MKGHRFVAVGACAIDTLLTVPHFPPEDSKLRALSLTTRRGGNCPNSLEVLQQLIHINDVCATSHESSTGDNKADELVLIATLPALNSAQIPFIRESFNAHRLPAESIGSPMCKVDLSHCVYRESHAEPVSSYIICSQSTGSRTIVNHNALEEMSIDEFKAVANNLLPSPNSNTSKQIWFHFEGRIPDTTLQCMRYLRDDRATTAGLVSLKISVELEKPGREGLQDLTREADVIFYSRSWAEGEGYTNARTCLLTQAEILEATCSDIESIARDRTLICTWGEKGACALLLSRGSDKSGTDERSIVTSPAYTEDLRPIVDTVGAGDTFIAGMLFGFMYKFPSGHYSLDRHAEEPHWSLERSLDFANELAGRKILQNGFSGLGEQVKAWLCPQRCGTKVDA